MGYMRPDAAIFVAGHRGLAGSAIVRALVRGGYTNLLVRTRAELDLLDAGATLRFFAEARPEFVVLAAARVGGVAANERYPADFLRENLAIQMNVMEAARICGVRRLLFLGSSCVYPRMAAQPMAESAMLTGPLEPTVRPYAIAKIAGIEQCWGSNRQYGTRFLAAMPCNLYGPGDNVHATNSHVMAALIGKAMAARASGARTMTVWGSGTPLREMMHSEDLAGACLFLLNLDEARYEGLLPGDAPPLINIGTGEEISIRGLAELIVRTLGLEVELVFDRLKPDGTPRKLLDSARLRGLGWVPGVSLEEGVRRTCAGWDLEQAVS